jgi:hypothetical protein
MLDQLSNILALTYNNAPFWGGSVRYIGDGAVAKPLGDLNKLRSGDYLGFAGSIVNDMGKMFKGVGTGVGDSFDALLRGDGKGALAALKGNKFLNNLNNYFHSIFSIFFYSLYDCRSFHLVYV